MIYKDSDMNRLIAELQSGVVLGKDEVVEGWLDNMSLYPLLYTVQTEALTYFKFTTSHDLRLGSKLEV
jgi:hypothetical protein